MTVKWLMHWQPNPGATLNSQILAEACACAEGLGGAKDGRWRTAMTFYRPMPRDSSAPPADFPRDFLGLALHDRPDTYFFILRAHRLVLHADASIQAIMEKLQSYKARVVFNFEGFQYKLGDFRLRVGKCVPSMAETLRGIMMEEALAKKSLPGHFIHIESNFADYGLQDHYTSQHTAVQYATCMAQLMAAVRS